MKPGLNISMLSTLVLLLAGAFAGSSCKRDEPEEPPQVETLEVASVGLHSINARGVILEKGSSPVSQHGFCWSTTGAPVYGTDPSILLGPAPDTGTFSVMIDGLQQNTTYYVRAFAENDAGIAYGTEIPVLTERLDTIPAVATSMVTDITENSARFGGIVKDEGGSEVTARGICWDTLPGPSLEGTHSVLGYGPGGYDTPVRGLRPETIYYIRAFATNANGTAYGNEVIFRTNSYPVTDIDGNVYPAIAIGRQIWLAQNLRVTRFPDGMPIDHLTETNDWSSLESDEKAYCFYSNNSVFRRQYGALYTWGAAVNADHRPVDGVPVVQGVCPDGWHLPTDEEWKELEMNLGMNRLDADNSGWRGGTEGGMLKVTGVTSWLSPNEGATDMHRFSALPGGDRLPSADFFNERTTGFWWTSTGADTLTAWARTLSYSTAAIYRSAEIRTFGYSVRCLRDG